MKFKRTICTIFALFLLFSVLLAASSCSASALYSEGDGEFRILCTSFAPFDFARVVGGDRVTVTILQDSGADLHNYTPTAATLNALSEADLFLYVGGVSDEAWVSDAIRDAGNDQLRTLCLMDLTEGIHAELANDWSEHAHEHEHEHEHEHDDETHGGHHGHDGHDHGADEHVWTSLRNAAVYVNAIRDLLCETDPVGAELYTSNAEAYVNELNALDADFSALAERVRQHTTVFADRFPFVYLMHDYHLPYVAAFSGCSTEVNSSFEMQIGLIKEVEAHKLPYIITIEGNDKALAEAIAAETGCRIVTLNSLQSVKRADIESGIRYLDVMKDNYKKLKEASEWH